MADLLKDAKEMDDLTFDLVAGFLEIKSAFVPTDLRIGFCESKFRNSVCWS
mgnify:CR=1 FL=1